MQFLLEGARGGESGLYITLSETREEIELVARSHGWDLSGINLFELVALEAKIGEEADSTFFHPSEVELSRTIETVLGEVDRVNPTRVVLDSLSELRMLAESPLRFRRQILQLKQFFAGRKITVLFLDDRSSGSSDLQIESVAHGVVSLQRSSPVYGICRRQLMVQKLRGSTFREGNHDLVLRKGGMLVFPRLVAAEHRESFERGSFASGIAELDTLLGGGLDRGTSNMFMGPPGTGKSTLAIRYVHAAAERGEKSLVFIFDETIGTYLSRARKLGMALEGHIDAGLINVQQIDPAEISPGELTFNVSRSAEERGLGFVVIDSINGYMNAMPEERYLTLQLHELLAYLNQQGVITIMVLAQQGLIGQMQASVELTYLADTVLMIRYYEAFGSVKQAISVIKKRSGNHERSIREIAIAKGGLEVGEPLTDLQGVLTGLPTRVNRGEQPPSTPPDA
jgi:circadian clock protein KaiC